MSHKNRSTTKWTSTRLRRHDMVQISLPFNIFYAQIHSLGKNILQSIVGQCQTLRFLHRNSHISTTKEQNQMSRDSDLCSETWLPDGTCIITFGNILITLLATQKVPNIFSKKSNMFGTFISTPSSAVPNEGYGLQLQFEWMFIIFHSSNMKLWHILFSDTQQSTQLQCCLLKFP